MNANGLQSSYQQQQQHGVDSFRVTQLDHSQGPVDGSLYAQVNKRKLESQIIQNGPTKLQNGGSYSSSIDSGISAFSGIVIFSLHLGSESNRLIYVCNCIYSAEKISINDYVLNALYCFLVNQEIPKKNSSQKSFFLNFRLKKYVKLPSLHFKLISYCDQRNK